jgi:hypothetical protein
MAWFSSLAQWIERRGGKRQIFRRNPDGSVTLYLERFYVLKTPFMEMMIHRFYESDDDYLHDHPWASCSLILATGYEEHVVVDGKVTPLFRPPGYFGYRSATAVHRVALRPGTAGSVWTLFTTFRREREWGFITPTGWIAAPEFFKLQGIEAVQADHHDYKGWLFPVRVSK